VFVRGQSADTPVVGDYNGDGTTDVAVYRESTGVWWVMPSGGAAPWSVLFGGPGDIPLLGIR